MKKPLFGKRKLKRYAELDANNDRSKKDGTATNASIQHIVSAFEQKQGAFLTAYKKRKVVPVYLRITAVLEQIISDFEMLKKLPETKAVDDAQRELKEMRDEKIKLEKEWEEINNWDNQKRSLAEINRIIEENSRRATALEEQIKALNKTQEEARKPLLAQIDSNKKRCTKKLNKYVRRRSAFAKKIAKLSVRYATEYDYYWELYMKKRRKSTKIHSFSKICRDRGVEIYNEVSILKTEDSQLNDLLQKAGFNFRVYAKPTGG